MYINEGKIAFLKSMRNYDSPNVNSLVGKKSQKQSNSNSKKLNLSYNRKGKK